MITGKQKKRLWLVGFLVIGIGLSVTLILIAFSKHIDLYYSPTDFQALPDGHSKNIRLGGMVVQNSVERSADLKVKFQLTDFEQSVTVSYAGILPDLFREGQGVVVMGKKRDGQHFEATQVLAKHDENYMPPEIARQNKSVKHAT